jgi:hypothetical protein
MKSNMAKQKKARTVFEVRLEDEKLIGRVLDKSGKTVQTFRPYGKFKAHGDSLAELLEAVAETARKEF